MLERELLILTEKLMNPTNFHGNIINELQPWTKKDPGTSGEPQRGRFYFSLSLHLHPYPLKTQNTRKEAPQGQGFNLVH